MKNQRKAALLLAMVVPTLAACQQQTSKIVSNENNGSGDNEDTSVVAESNTAIINIDEAKCVGCGHCVRNDSVDFAMTEDHKAVVISASANPDSENLQRAISSCPTEAITI